MYIQRRERERQLESAEASSITIICRFASAPLLWVQWLSGKSVRLVIGRSWVRFPAGSLWIFLSLSKAYIKITNLLCRVCRYCYWVYRTSNNAQGNKQVVIFRCICGDDFNYHVNLPISWCTIVQRSMDPLLLGRCSGYSVLWTTVTTLY